MSVDGQPVRLVEDIATALEDRKAGDEVEVVVVRGLPYRQERVTVQVEVKPPSSFR